MADMEQPELANTGADTESGRRNLRSNHRSHQEQPYNYPEKGDERPRHEQAPFSPTEYTRKDFSAGQAMILPVETSYRPCGLPKLRFSDHSRGSPHLTNQDLHIISRRTRDSRIRRAKERVRPKLADITKLADISRQALSLVKRIPAAPAPSLEERIRRQKLEAALAILIKDALNGGNPDIIRNTFKNLERVPELWSTSHPKTNIDDPERLPDAPSQLGGQMRNTTAQKQKMPAKKDQAKPQGTEASKIPNAAARPLAQPLTQPRPQPLFQLPYKKVHRKNISLRHSLIKYGQPYPPGRVNPRAPKTPATKPTVSKVQPRDFLVPSQDQQGRGGWFDTAAASKPFDGKSRTDGYQPLRPCAGPDTPIHQLYYPQELRMACKAAELKWNDKAWHANNVVWIVHDQVDYDIVNEHLFTSGREANAKALEKMAHAHPEAFAIPDEVADDDNDNQMTGIKMENNTSNNTTNDDPETVNEVIRRLLAPATSRLSTTTTTPSTATATTVTIKNEDEDGPPASSQIIPRRQAVRPPTNQRGQITLSDAPEPRYVYWGEWEIDNNHNHSYGVRLEARCRDGENEPAAYFNGNGIDF
ncbi:hypothetical protein F4778DRAFT_796743 [Xylariomycetidae sp. FL2044]|nr:hypothetical protein F4778DRAFT_796743 [Xylariomycetidae sp. FL2044]